MDVLVRGHECVPKGFASHFDGKCITVFSASNYCGYTNNQAAVLSVISETHYEVKTFPPLQWLLRRDVEFRQPDPATSQGSRLGARARTMFARQVLSASVLPGPGGKKPAEEARSRRNEAPILVSKSPSVLAPRMFLGTMQGRESARRKTLG
jgi:hypothetical protein